MQYSRNLIRFVIETFVGHLERMGLFIFSLGKKILRKKSLSKTHFILNLSFACEHFSNVSADRGMKQDWGFIISYHVKLLLW